MNRYRLDPKNPPRLTPEEERRLDETAIDYSDIPPLGEEFFSQAKRGTDMTDDPTPGLYEEDYVFARLLEILFKHTEIGRDELCSCGNRLANDLIAYLAEEDFPLEITGEFGGYIFAKVTPEGRALLEQLRAEEGRDRARKDSLPP